MAERPTVFVDADACPVKPEVVRVAERYELPVTFVANGGLRPSRDPMIRNVVVSGNLDAADDWIADHVTASDIVITADVPLAGRCVANGAHVLGPTGRVFDDTNIGMATAVRDLNQQLRESGEIRSYNAAFTQKDRSRFLEALDRIARRALKDTDAVRTRGSRQS